MYCNMSELFSRFAHVYLELIITVVVIITPFIHNVLNLQNLEHECKRNQNEQRKHVKIGYNNDNNKVLHCQ